MWMLRFRNNKNIKLQHIRLYRQNKAIQQVNVAARFKSSNNEFGTLQGTRIVNYYLTRHNMQTCKQSLLCIYNVSTVLAERNTYILQQNICCCTFLFASDDNLKKPREHTCNTFISEMYLYLLNQTLSVAAVFVCHTSISRVAFSSRLPNDQRHHLLQGKHRHQRFTAFLHVTFVHIVVSITNYGGYLKQLNSISE